MLDRLADELQAGVAEERPGKQSAFTENLESVADAHHESAVRGEFLHCLHHRRESRDRAAAQIIAIREAAGKDDRIDVAEPAANRARCIPLDDRGFAIRRRKHRDRNCCRERRQRRFSWGNTSVARIEIPGRNELTVFSNFGIGSMRDLPITVAPLARGGCKLLITGTVLSYGEYWNPKCICQLSCVCGVTNAHRVRRWRSGDLLKPGPSTPLTIAEL